MKVLFNIILTLILLGLILWCFEIVRIENAKADTPEGPNHSLILTLYGAVILLGAGIAIIFALTVVPFFAERAAGLVYGPTEKLEKGPHADALSRAAQGDYEGAIAAYERVLADKDPEDTLALSEIAHLYADKLGDPQAAVDRLTAALERDWEPDKAAFLTFRLADLYWKNLAQFEPARLLLEQILERMPGSTHSANAMHRIREIDIREREAQEAAFLSSASESSLGGDDARQHVDGELTDQGDLTQSAPPEREDEHRPT